MQPLLGPGQRLVDRDGRLWRWDGFVRIGGGSSAAAEQLRQRNRLEQLAGEIAEARAQTRARRRRGRASPRRARDRRRRRARRRRAVAGRRRTAGAVPPDRGRAVAPRPGRRGEARGGRRDDREDRGRPRGAGDAERRNRGHAGAAAGPCGLPRWRSTERGPRPARRAAAMPRRAPRSIACRARPKAAGAGWRRWPAKRNPGASGTMTPRRSRRSWPNGTKRRRRRSRRWLSVPRRSPRNGRRWPRAPL